MFVDHTSDTKARACTLAWVSRAVVECCDMDTGIHFCAPISSLYELPTDISSLPAEGKLLLYVVSVSSLPAAGKLLLYVVSVSTLLSAGKLLLYVVSVISLPATGKLLLYVVSVQ